MGTMRDPKWWSTEHGTTWERVKSALRRDWEQTKADVSAGGRELDQDVDDTVTQAVGSTPVPPLDQKNPPDAKDAKDAQRARGWDDVEDSYRYGAGARHEYKDTDWNDGLESKLKQEWEDLKTGRTWAETRDAAKHGWDRVKTSAR